MADTEARRRATAEERLLQRQDRGEVAFWERALAFLSAALLVGIVAYLGWQTVTEGEEPPVLRIEAGGSQPNGAGFLVGFTATNHGSMTATSLEVVGRLERDGVVVEESRATIDYLPPRSTRAGGLLFSRDPSGFELVLTPSGYADP